MVRPEVKKKQRQQAEAAKQSKKARRLLEKVVLRKKLKVDRGNVLAELKRVQLQPDQLDQLHSTSSMQTKGLKRFADESDSARRETISSGTERAERCLDASLLIKRRRRRSKRAQSESSSSSEDTDAMSTDTEEYYNDSDRSGDFDCETSHQAKQQQAAQAKQLQDSSAAIQTKVLETVADHCEEHNPMNGSAGKTTLVKGEKIPAPEAKKSKPAVFVPVNRDPDIERARLELPIIGEEQRIMEEICYNDVVIISGETGSGKTTQIPQFLYEAGYTLNGKLIGITEPRRVAAVSMSERVAQELNLTQDEVAYQIRFSGNVSAKTQIKFMTDGVLMRECQNDFLLSKYSVIIIDEAHERSVFSDILIGLLSRIVPLRAKKGNPLKLIIMSATLRVKDFTENTFLFPKVPPVINIEARQFPVSTHFAKQTPSDYLSAAYKKVCSIHAKMPRGGILVFVTSQMDVRVLCKKLRKKPLIHCLGLYAMLPIQKQQLVFKRPPEGTRLCVIATNVAETSITIPNIKYVVDSGYEKRKLYDLFTGVSRFITNWTSKSSAEQRAGRAGRMGPGQCYRLYSSAVFANDFEDHAQPQILQKPVDDVLLQMKTMNIDNVVNFPFPTRPSIEALKAAEKKLIVLGALDDSKSKTARFSELDKTEYAARPTPLGKAMANYPVSARCSKMIVLAPQELLPHTICLVAALTAREMFLEGNQWQVLRKKWLGHGNFKMLGDFMVMLRACCIADKVKCSNRKCLSRGLRTKAMLEIDKLRRQLTHDINKNKKDASVPDVRMTLTKPTEAQCKILRQLLLASFCDRVARKLPDGEIKIRKTDDPNVVENRKLKHAYECMEVEQPVYITTDSALKGQHPEFIIYKELFHGNKRTYMRDVSVIEPEWLPFHAERLCSFSDKSETNTAPRYDPVSDQILCSRSTTYGPLNWSLGIVDVPMHLVESSIELFKQFAAHLLAGDVIDWFKKYSDKLLSPPSIMTKPWSKLQPRTNKLLQALVSANIKSKRDLLRIWEVQSSYLKSEYLAWLPESQHAQVSSDWEQLQKTLQ